MDNLNEMKLNRHGTYEEIKSEKEVLNITTKEKKVVAHFFHKDFRRCQILDGHLEVKKKILLYIYLISQLLIYKIDKILKFINKLYYMIIIIIIYIYIHFLFIYLFYYSLATCKETF